MKPFITSHLLDVRSEQRESGEQCDLVYQYGQGFENGCDSRFRLQVQTDDRERDCFPSSDQVNTSRQWELHLSVFKSYRNICTPPQHHCGRNRETLSRTAPSCRERTDFILSPKYKRTPLNTHVYESLCRAITR